jgi:flavin reductase (DIM6/NTAB) family NADH-FMN oxidoreductase RutF
VATTVREVIDILEWLALPAAALQMVFELLYLNVGTCFFPDAEYNHRQDICSCQSNCRKEEAVMREKLKITEGIFPMPVLMVATYNEDGSVNVMNAAWGTMQERDTVALNLTESHKTVKNIKARGAFTVSIADAAHLVEADYFGIETGNKVPDKFDRSGLTASKAETVDAPVINEFPICLECRFIEYQSNEYGCGVIGKVVNATADESVMVDGKIDMSLVNAIAFDPYTHGYYKVTERVGNAFKDGMALKK